MYIETNEQCSLFDGKITKRFLSQCNKAIPNRQPVRAPCVRHIGDNFVSDKVCWNYFCSLNRITVEFYYSTNFFFQQLKLLTIIHQKYSRMHISINVLTKISTIKWDLRKKSWFYTDLKSYIFIRKFINCGLKSTCRSFILFCNFEMLNFQWLLFW